MNSKIKFYLNYNKIF